MEDYIDDSHIHDGHRGRMRAKLIRYGHHIFDSYEILEMLLYQAVPLKDTNPIAKRLIKAFGGLDGVLSAGRDSLLMQNGVGERVADYICLVDRLSDIIGAEMLTDDGVDLTSYDSVGRHLTDYFRGVSEKRTVALYLDGAMQLIDMRMMYELDYESGGVKPKAFIDRAMACSASVVITAHNHPFGPFYPTQGDRATHQSVSEALSAAGLIHAEHYIICGEDYAGMGSLSNFGARLAQMPALGRFLHSAEATDHADEKIHIREVNCDPEEKLRGYNRQDMPYLAELISYVSSDSSALAEKLINKYRTIENIFTVQTRELVNLVGEKCAFYLKLLAYVCSRRRTDLITMGHQYSRAEQAEYLKALFLGESVEKTYLLAFDGRDNLLGCELLSEGTVSASEVMPRKAVECALAFNAKRVSIAHNHPFGNPRPSNEDLSVTKLFDSLFASCDITLSDHFIIAGQLCDTIEIEKDSCC